MFERDPKLWIISLVATIMLSNVVAAGPTYDIRDLSVEQRPFVETLEQEGGEAPASDIGKPIEQPPYQSPGEAECTDPPCEQTDTAGIDERIDLTLSFDREPAVYRPGETVVMTVSVDQDAHVTVLDIGTSAVTHIVFPNEYQQDNAVVASEFVDIPDPKASFQFKVAGPEGCELIWVFATKSSEPLIKEELLERISPFPVVSRSPRELARDIAVTLREEQHEGWGQTSAVFWIESEEPITED